MPGKGADPDWAPGKSEPRLSIIVPVYREGGSINALIDHLVQSEGADACEIILVDGDAGSTLRQLHPGFRSLVRSTLSPRGRGRQMNHGAGMARAGYLLFLHADARGGYPEWPLMEDVEMMRQVKSGGWPIALLQERVMTSPRRWEKEGVLACTLRNWVLQILFRMGVSPEKLSRWYPAAAA